MLRTPNLTDDGFLSGSLVNANQNALTRDGIIIFVLVEGSLEPAFSTSPDKEAEAMEFGAHRFIPSSDPKELKYAALSLDFLISTVHADLDWPTYLNILKPNGKLCFVGAAPQPIPVPVMLLIMGQRSVCGSAIGSRDRIHEMLEFCAHHGIKPKTEHMSMADCNSAIDKVRANKTRYRMVLEN